MLAVLALLSTLASSLCASSLTWDSDGDPANGITNGGGTWDTTSNKWYDGSSDQIWNNANRDIAVFGDGTAFASDAWREITVQSSGVTVGGLTFSSGSSSGSDKNYRLSGGDITLASSTGIARIDIGNSNSTVPVIASSLHGTDIEVGFNGSGATYYFDGAASDWTGNLHLVNNGSVTKNGVVNIRVAGALSSAPTATVTVDAGCGFQLGAAATYSMPITLNGYGFEGVLHRGRGALQASVDGVTHTGNITLASDSAISPNSGTMTLSGVISGNYTLTKTGIATLLLTNSNTYTGNTEIYRGTLTLDSASGPAINKNGGDLLFRSTLAASSVVNLNLDEQIGDSAAIRFEMAGGSYSGTVNLLGHTETVAGMASDTNATTSDTLCNIQNNSASTVGVLVVDVPAGANGGLGYSFRGRLRDQAGTLAVVKRGDGIQSLAGANSGLYTGGLTVEAGTLDVTTGVLPTVGPAGGYAVTLSGGVLQLGDSMQTSGAMLMTGGTLESGPYNGGSLSSASTFDFRAGAATAILAGTGTLTKTGSGLVVLTNANTYTGKTLIREGTLALGHNSNLYYPSDGSFKNSPLVEISAGATLDVSGVTTPFAVAPTQTLQGFGTIVGNVTDSTDYIAPSTLGAGNSTTAGTLTLTNNLTLANNSNLAFDLSTSSAGTNDKIVVSGNLNLAGSVTNIVINPLGNSLDTTAPYTVLTYGGSVTGDASNLAIVNTTRYSVTKNLDTVNKKITVSVSGTATPLTLTWVGDGYPNEWNANSTANWQIGSTTGQKFYTLDSVVFDDSSINTNVNLIGKLHPTNVTVNSANNYTFTGAGAIIGIGTTLTKSGSGILTIDNTGLNEFTGEVMVTGGSLVLGFSSVAPLGTSAGGTTISGTGSLDLNGHAIAEEAITVSGSGPDGMGAIVNSLPNAELYQLRNVTLANNAAFGGMSDWAIGGVGATLAGNGKSLAKFGTNVIKLDNIGETNLGDVSIHAGRLTLIGTTTLGDGSKTLALDGNAELLLSASLSAHAKDLTVGSGGGTILVQGGSSSLTGNTATAGALNGTLALKVTTGDTFALGNSLTGSGTIQLPSLSVSTYSSYATVILSGNNSYSGGTTIDAGLAKMASANALGTGPITINSVGSGSSRICGGLDLNGNSIANAMTLNGPGPGSSGITIPGTLSNSATGTTSEVSGDIVLGTVGEYFGTKNNIVLTEGNLKLSGLLSGGNTGDNIYTFVKQGNMTMTISRPDNTFNGYVYISSGVLEVTKLANINEASSLGLIPDTTLLNNKIRFALPLANGTPRVLRYIGNTPSITDKVLQLELDGAVEANGATSGDTLTFTSSTSIADGTSGTLTLAGTNTGNNTFAGIITGGIAGIGGLTKDGPGKWAIMGANTYTGATKVLGGTLSIDTLTNGGVAGPLGAGGNAADKLVFGTGGKLLYTGDDAAIDRGFTLGAGGGVIDTASVLTLSGTVAGVDGGGLTKAGAGTLVLSGNVHYSGDTLVHAGTLQFSSPSAVVGNIQGTGTVRVGGSASATLTATSINVDTLSIGGSSVAAVPEPGTWALLLAAASVVVVFRKLRFFG